MASRKHEYFMLYKPYGVLSQFTDRGGRQTLNNYGPFPPTVYPVGRLDADSEGLLFLTNDTMLKEYLLEPRFEHPRTYWVQVEGVPEESALRQLEEGVLVEGHKTKPADVRLMKEEPPLPPRPVPIRFRKHVPTSWIELTLREGRNRQVRKMTAAIGHPTLRLVRVQMGNLSLGSMLPGESRPLDEAEREELKKQIQMKYHKKPRRAP
ncbi:MAG: pseudouridine synthase [Ignavibacteriales bacterium]|nr:pseudouridine synthase [Ignavibacteriales bacterium]